MSDAFKLTGSYTVTPQSNPLSLAFNGGADINEAKTIKAKQVYDLDLTADSPVAVVFGGVVNAHVVILKVVSGKVKARVTSADGATQAVPFETVLAVINDSVPITAIDLTRVTGVLTTVRVFLAEKA